LDSHHKFVSLSKSLSCVLNADSEGKMARYVTLGVNLRPEEERVFLLKIGALGMQTFRLSFMAQSEVMLS
jgi:hypothetical protein